MEKASTRVLGEIKHYLLRENKANEKVIYYEMLRYAQVYIKRIKRNG